MGDSGGGEAGFFSIMSSHVTDYLLLKTQGKKGLIL